MLRRDLLRLLGFSAMAGASGHGMAACSFPSAEQGRSPGFEPDVEFTLTAAPGEAQVLAGAPTRVWRFTGQLIKGPATTLQALPDSYLGPVIRLRRGQKVRVHFNNRLAEQSIVHWHGLDVPEAADGHPRLAVSLIRFRGHLPKGGYDGTHGIKQGRPASAAAVQ